ncbi:sensor histidine kinase [Streptosporangium sp. CA-135522]|uniref:sensor histidine kinase n=1 Tax=Streptosporangium sp. CA-135522 TaxID=3240072 RepID=UPI003D8D3D1F
MIVAGIGGSSVFGAAAMASVTTAVVALVWVTGRPRTRTRPAAVTGAAAVVSLSVTLAHLMGLPLVQEVGMWGMVESAALMLLVALTVRWSPVPQAAVTGALAGSASAVWLLRFFTPSSLLEGVGACAFWSIGALVTAGAGAYLRSLDTGRARAVADSRTAVRLQVAGDLHDFVAHDVSEMVAQAQAGQVVGAGDPTQALRALERIEKAGLRAMSAMDRTVLMLHEDEFATTAPVPGLAELPELADRFSAAGRPRVQVDMAGELGERVPREAAATAYRIVVEALTNVRRHAREATRVDISVSAGPASLLVTVTNDGVTGSAEGGRGGFGLPTMAEHLRSLGGDLHAGAVPAGWSLTARIPLTR